jgi:lipoprotein-anchoring transpeptidase ErfK/SrfK
VPGLKKTSKSSRRGPRRGGDFFAAGLLLVILAGLGWLWWRQGENGKPPGAKPIVQKNVRPPVAPPRVQPAAPKPVVPETVKPAPPAVAAAVPPPDFPHPARNVFEAQVALARQMISPGGIDGAIGSQTRAAITAFQRLKNLPPTESLDTNTCDQLILDAPLLTNYMVTTNDLAQLQPLGATWVAKSEQSSLAYESILEMVAEKAHAYQSLIRKLNPGVDWPKVAAGTVLKIPAVEYPEPAEKAAFVVIHLSARFLEAFGARTNLLLHCPCSIAAKVEKRPVGELHVVVVAPHPNYTVNPELFPESEELQALGHKLILPPGPNNPVGVAWIGLNLPGYGMHGTPVPELVGRTESHGCFRLANWDAAYLLKLVWVGMPVEVVP